MKPITRAAIFMGDNLTDPVARMGTRPNGNVFYRTVGGILYEFDEAQIAVLDRFKFKIRMTPELAGTPPPPAQNVVGRAEALEEAALLVEGQWNHCWPSDIAAAIRALANTARAQNVVSVDIDQRALSVADDIVRQMMDKGALLAVRDNDDELVPMALDRQFQLKAGWQIAIAAALAPEPHVLPQDVITLVIAAREFWEANEDMSGEANALDKALEAFADRVPYANEPDDEAAASEGSANG
jgi:hypothetical protein